VLGFSLSKYYLMKLPSFITTFTLFVVLVALLPISFVVVLFELHPLLIPAILIVGVILILFEVRFKIGKCLISFKIKDIEQEIKDLHISQIRSLLHTQKIIEAESAAKSTVLEERFDLIRETQQKLSRALEIAEEHSEARQRIYDEYTKVYNFLMLFINERNVSGQRLYEMAVAAGYDVNSLNEHIRLINEEREKEGQ